MKNRIKRSDALRIPLVDNSVDLVMGSPPYLKARDYGILDQNGDKMALRDPHAWSDWMIEVSLEALRVSRGLVVWVVSGETDKGEYQPGPEGLIWKWYERGFSQKRPCYWIKNGLFGSGGKHWFRNDVEYIIAFKSSGLLTYANPTAMGNPPKFAPGGPPSHRNRDGSRVARKNYSPPRLCNPGNVVRASVGKGHMGHVLAHENEAPYPEKLPTFFITTHTPPGGSVCDPFCGSGTTLAAAKRLGRSYAGFDIRQSQVDLSRRRLESTMVDLGFMGAE